MSGSRKDKKNEAESLALPETKRQRPRSAGSSSLQVFEGHKRRTSLPENLTLTAPFFAHKRGSSPEIMPSRHRLPSISEDKRELLTPEEMPPRFIAKVQKVSRMLKGVVFSFRGNSSAPAYHNPGYPKPPSVKGKLSNIPCVEGFLAVNQKYVKRDKTGKALVYPPHALPEDKEGNCTLAKMPIRRSLEYFMEGLNSKPPKFKLACSVEEIKKTGILRVSPTTAWPDVNEMEFKVDLNSKDTTPPLAGVRRDAMTPVEAEVYAQPEWYTGEDWKIASQQNYVLHDEDGPIMVFGMEGPAKSVVPIIGDQDLLWITIPKDTYDLLPDKKLATEPINTRAVLVLPYDAGEIPSGFIDMQKALLQIDKDLNGGNATLFEDHTDIPAAVADWGILTPYEAYAAIMINKEFGIEFSHLLSLIQHGPENRSPYKPEDLNGNINHIGTNFVEQTNTEDELVFVARDRFLKNQIFAIHKGWDMEKWGSIVRLQQAQGFPVSKETLEALDKYEKNFITVDVIQERSSFIEKPQISFFSEESKRVFREFAEKNQWKYDDEKNLLTKDVDTISIRQSGLHAKDGAPQVLSAMAEIFQAMKIQDRVNVHGKKDAFKAEQIKLAGIESRRPSI